MNGRILLDTNAIIYALNYGLKLPNNEYFVSFITEIELLSFGKLSEDESHKIRTLLNHFHIIDIDKKIKEKTISIRKKYGIKLPDSIICATAQEFKTTLVTNDKQLKKIEGLNVITIESFST